MRFIVIVISLFSLSKGILGADFHFSEQSKKLIEDGKTLTEDWNTLSRSNKDKGLKDFLSAVTKTKFENETSGYYKLKLEEEFISRLLDWNKVIYNIAQEIGGTVAEELSASREFKISKEGTLLSIIPVISKGNQKLELPDLAFTVPDILLSSSKQILSKSLFKYRGNKRIEYNSITKYDYLVPKVPRIPIDGVENFYQNEEEKSILIPEEENNEKKTLACKLTNEKGEEGESGEFYLEIPETEKQKYSPYLQIHSNFDCTLVELKESSCNSYQISDNTENVSKDLFKVLAAYETDKSIYYSSSAPLNPGLYKYYYKDSKIIPIQKDFSEETTESFSIRPKDGFWGINYSKEKLSPGLEKRLTDYKSYKILNSIDLGDNEFDKDIFSKVLKDEDFKTIHQIILTKFESLNNFRTMNFIKEKMSNLKEVIILVPENEMNKNSVKNLAEDIKSLNTDKPIKVEIKRLPEIPKTEILTEKPKKPIEPEKIEPESKPALQIPKSDELPLVTIPMNIQKIFASFGLLPQQIKVKKDEVSGRIIVELPDEPYNILRPLYVNVFNQARANLIPHDFLQKYLNLFKYYIVAGPPSWNNPSGIQTAFLDRSQIILPGEHPGHPLVWIELKKSGQ